MASPGRDRQGPQQQQPWSSDPHVRSTYTTTSPPQRQQQQQQQQQPSSSQSSTTGSTSAASPFHAASQAGAALAPQSSAELRYATKAGHALPRRVLMHYLQPGEHQAADPRRRHRNYHDRVQLGLLPTTVVPGIHDELYLHGNVSTHHGKITEAVTVMDQAGFRPLGQVVQPTNIPRLMQPQHVAQDVKGLAGTQAVVQAGKMTLPSAPGARAHLEAGSALVAADGCEARKEGVHMMPAPAPVPTSCPHPGLTWYLRKETYEAVPRQRPTKGNTDNGKPWLPEVEPGKAGPRAKAGGAQGSLATVLPQQPDMATVGVASHHAAHTQYLHAGKHAETSMRAGSNGMMAEGAAPELLAHIRVMHQVACDGMAAQAAAPRPYLHAGKHAQESAAAGMPSIRAQLFAGKHAEEALSPFATGLSPPPVPQHNSIRVVPGAITAGHLSNYEDGLGMGRQGRGRRLRRSRSQLCLAGPEQGGGGSTAAGGGLPSSGALQQARSLPPPCLKMSPWASWE